MNPQLCFLISCILAIGPLNLTGRRHTATKEAALSTQLPAAGAVPDAPTALAIARVLLGRFAGQRALAAEEPLRAVRSGRYWIIEHGPAGQHGGLFLEFSAQDCRVVEMSYGK